MTKQKGIITVMMQRFESCWLPDTLKIKEKVDRGEKLSERDTAFLEEVIQDIRRAQVLVDQYPEFQGLYGRVAHLYHEITARALENEKAGQAASH